MIEVFCTFMCCTLAKLPTRIETVARDKKLHHKLPSAAPSVRGNPTEMCFGGNAGVQSSQDNMEKFRRLI